MARQSGITVENDFTAGLVTEATALNYPPNAAFDADNVIFEAVSRVTRRKGLLPEVGSTNRSVSRTLSSAFRTYQWKSVGGQGDVNFTVVQIGSTLYFFEESPTAALSAGYKSYTVNLASFQVTGAPSPAGAVAEFASGNNGYLFVAHPSCEPFYCKVDLGSNSISTIPIDVQIRDMKGLDDGLRVDERPSSLSSDHRYNLYNQGWATRIQGQDGGNSFTGTAIQAWRTWRNLRTDWPSNSDVWWYYRVIADEDPDAIGSFNNREADRYQMGNTPAPKGHFIMSAFNMDRNAATANDDTPVTGLPVVSTTSRPASVAFFAGRVWFAGVADQGWAGKIYFSQIIEEDYQIGHCYQENDPTSEKIYDLLPTDGGIVQIPEIGTVVKMLPIGDSLYIFATNGIWAVGGSEGVGFKANDYAVRKVSTVDSLSTTAFVDIEGFPVWWNQDSIYVMQPDATGQVSAVSISDERIKTLYKNIPVVNKSNVRGVFDAQDKKIYWLYNDQVVSANDAKNFTRTLVFDFRTKAFYTYSFERSGATNRGYISDLVYIPGYGIKLATTRGSGSSYNLIWSEFRSTNYLDWDAVDYKSYFYTGYRIAGDTMRDFQGNYISVFFDHIPGSSCILQGSWDWATDSNSSRRSSSQQLYINRANRAIQNRRLKIRGRGKSLQLLFESETGKPFSIIGWGFKVTANEDV